MRILWLKTELLHPVDKGGKIRTYQMLRAINAKHPITYLTLDDGSAAPDARARALEYASAVETVPFRVTPRGTPRFFGELATNLFSPLAYSLARYEVPAFRERVREHLASRDIDLVVCDFLTPWVNLPSDAAGFGVPIVLFQHNVEAEIWRRHAEVAGNPLSRWYFGLQHRRMAHYERAACLAADHVVAVSEHDARIFRERYGVASVSDVPTGVDVQFFDPAPYAARVPGRLVFTGSMDWMPNADGISWFTEQVWPRVRAARPDATFTVVGRNPPAAVQALATPGSGIEVTGSVPDVRPYLGAGSAFVVPLRIGGGTRLKIYEAMAMECPIVSTTVGAEGLPVRHEEHLRLADDAAGFAAQCVALLDDVSTAGAMAHRAAHYVRSNFGWDAVADHFVASCVAAAPAAGGSAPVPEPQELS
jgi:glycosyltransferase involved in cell wall biosynthesis